MDPLTHAVLGGAAGYALFGRKLGLRAAGIGALAAFVPDADVFIRSEHEPLLYVEYHRQFTHSVFFAIPGSFLISLIWMLRKRFRPDWMAIWACALTAWLTHSLLDASTTYGTELLWPFSNERFSWNLISIIDPVFTLPLLLCLIVALVRAQPRIASGALIFCLAYIGIGGIQRERARAGQIQTAGQRGHHPERFEVMPTIGNNIVWRGLYEFEGRIYSDRFRVGWISGPMVCEGTSLPRLTPEELTPFEQDRNRGNQAFERFSRFSSDWVARSPFDPTLIGDMRYSLSTEAFDPIWGIRFTEPGEPTNYLWVTRTRERRMDFGHLWREIAGDDPCYRGIQFRLKR